MLRVKNEGHSISNTRVIPHHVLGGGLSQC